MSQTGSPTSYDGPERRASPRIPASAVPYLTACIGGGPAVRLIDLSKRGVQIETTMHMRAGSTMTIRFVSAERSVVLTGAVVRSTVEVLESCGGVTYHTALAFTEELTLCDEEFEAARGLPAPGWTRDERADDYTMIVMDGRTTAAHPAGGPAAY